MDKDRRAELLKDEYIMLQQFYEEIDGKGLTIKNWAITVALATIGAGILYKSTMILAIAFGASIVFWYLEAHWRGLSHFFAVRINEIEALFKNGKTDKAIPFQVYTKWDEEYDNVGDQTIKYMKKWRVAIPHVLIAILSSVLIVLQLCGILK